ncbi:basic leucine zipper transcriptional factor ATF-like 3 isoform 2-T9 [Salvelinus alpinus]|uniref:basic leucine zipper transcriptional factor ATF-like 3 isoform X1 n=1 Tax=Salvelinus sp. IW2-2015 TaxID=2691554 RepID=UPI000CEAD176|nr:basic leucine zipper transcriptional factor ATF-like 3 isoform X2 [Salvelinus alpinus]
MSDCDISSGFLQINDQSSFMLQRCESSGDEDDDWRLKRRDNNRVAAQKSRKRQTQRADELHKAYECLDQKNRRLKKEVQFLSEEQRRLTEALKAHEPLCPIRHCVPTLGSGPWDVGVLSSLPR